MKKALITGITGQDGSYLAELLLKKNPSISMPFLSARIAYHCNIKLLIVILILY